MVLIRVELGLLVTFGCGGTLTSIVAVRTREKELSCALVARPVTPTVFTRPHGVTAVVSSTVGDLLMPFQNDGSTAVPARHSI